MRFETFASGVAIAGLMAAPAPAAAQTGAAAFKPAGQWALDYGDDYCRLSRNFSDGTNALSVAFERIQPGPTMRLVMVGPELKTYRGASELGWHFMPNDAQRKVVPQHSKTSEGKFWYNFGPITITPAAPPAPGAPPTPPPPYSRSGEQTAAKALTGFMVDGSVTQPVQVDTGDLGAPLAALQVCADDLAKSWGLDPAKLQTETAAAIPAGGGSGWLPQGTVGFGDFGKLGGGSNQVRLMVDATGKATSCAIHWPTLDATTNDKICKAALANAKFTPAKDASGQPMPGYWIGSPMFMGPPFPGGRSR